MAKQTILGRVAQLAKANVNALLDQAEDPQSMLDQLIRDYTSNITEAEQAVAGTIGNLRLLEQDHQEDVDAAREWGEKARAASRKADELRASDRPARRTSSTTWRRWRWAGSSRRRRRPGPPSRPSPPSGRWWTSSSRAWRR